MYGTHEVYLITNIIILFLKFSENKIFPHKHVTCELKNFHIGENCKKPIYTELRSLAGVVTNCSSVTKLKSRLLLMVATFCCEYMYLNILLHELRPLKDNF